jgi:hypothetical protein
MAKQGNCQGISQSQIYANRENLFSLFLLGRHNCQVIPTGNNNRKNTGNSKKKGINGEIFFRKQVS